MSNEEYMPCIKLPVVVHVRKQRECEQHVSTREGLTPILPSDLIMRGVNGEEYPIGLEIFNKTYTFDLSVADETQTLRKQVAELEANKNILEQALTDPENQPSQFGTVPIEWYELHKDKLDDVCTKVQKVIDSLYGSYEKHAIRKALQEAIE